MDYEDEAGDDDSPNAIKWLFGAIVVALLIIFSALVYAEPARADDCAYTIENLLPRLSHPGTVLSDPDAIKAVVEALKAQGAPIPDTPPVTRILIMVNDAGVTGYAVELNGCATGPYILPPGPPA